LPGRADGYPSGPPTDPDVRNSRIRFLRQSGCYPRKVSLAPQSTGLPWSGLVSSRSLPCLPPADALPDGAFPPVGRLGLTSPPSPVLCAATTATRPISGSFTCRSFPDTLPASVCLWCPKRAHGRVEAPDHARAFGHPVPHSGNMLKETGGSPKFPSYPYGCMPRSQTPVVSSTLAIPRPGLLPSGACKPSAFPSLRDILLSTTLHIAGLNHAACVLATPGFVRPLAGRHAGSLLTCWLDVSQGGLEP
jgi:hypothetical protein